LTRQQRGSPFGSGRRSSLGGCGLIYDGLIVPSDFIMARSMLRGIARRAEGQPSDANLRDAERRLMTQRRILAGGGAVFAGGDPGR
jgi:hypothetical protein